MAATLCRKNPHDTAILTCDFERLKIKDFLWFKFISLTLFSDIQGRNRKIFLRGQSHCS